MFLLFFKKENTEKLLTEIISFVSTISSSFLSLLCSISLLLAGLYRIRSKVDLEDALSCTRTLHRLIANVKNTLPY
jgi:preprotein translocase subunit SecY